MLPAIFFLKISSTKKFFSLFTIPLILFSLYLYGSYSVNLNQKNLNKQTEKYNIKVISPNFELKYGLNIEEIKLRLKKLIRYSEPSKNVQTLFIWPEGVFSGYSYKELLTLKKYSQVVLIKIIMFYLE